MTMAMAATRTCGTRIRPRRVRLQSTKENAVPDDIET